MAWYRKSSSTENILLYLVAVFAPPVPVFLKKELGPDFWINIILWLLFWLPGVLHAWYVIAKSEGRL